MEENVEAGDDAQWGKIEIMRPKNQKIDFFSFRLKLIPHYSKLFVDLSMCITFLFYNKI